MVLYPPLTVALLLFIVIGIRRRNHLFTGRPDVSDTERNVFYASGAIVLALLLLTLLL